MAEATTKTKSDDNLMAALSYLMTFITGAVIYLTQKDKGNKYVLFHAMQAIMYGVAVFAVWIVIMILGVVLMWIPFVGWLIGIVIWFGWIAVFFISWVFLMYKAYSGVKYKLPVIGDMAEKYAG